ncbi:cupin domain-containing protein [Rhodocytophaga rosea]|uniref:Cupin domain-containing protein n=1 Tax=Rhodocytophaga rosea TaxID=2704465 RepID=A0A6C0GUA8_9BACT|nr:cupin domain-containing protein [Rhodocytophaga rosea]QHT71133.1 cupin domain-containing protein [Rhodocytophaga rosea]
MTIQYPHTIENCTGEKIIFHGIQQEPDGDKVLVENFVSPGHGPLMHTHFLQDEALTVIKGKLGYQIPGQAAQYVGEGESVIFKRGVPHRFWNAGEDILTCKGWIKPANTIVFFLSAIYAAQNKSGNSQPEKFDSAYLLTRYASEYDILGIPAFVRKTIIPITYLLGKLLGKYKHFKDAPAPVTR